MVSFYFQRSDRSSARRPSRRPRPRKERGRSGRSANDALADENCFGCRRSLHLSPVALHQHETNYSVAHIDCRRTFTAPSPTDRIHTIKHGHIQDSVKGCRVRHSSRSWRMGALYTKVQLRPSVTFRLHLQHNFLCS
jgi:hypothetical protein